MTSLSCQTLALPTQKNTHTSHYTTFKLGTNLESKIEVQDRKGCLDPTCLKLGPGPWCKRTLGHIKKLSGCWRSCWLLMWVHDLKPNCWVELRRWTHVYFSAAKGGGGSADEQAWGWWEGRAGQGRASQVRLMHQKKYLTCLHLWDISQIQAWGSSCLFVKRAYRGKSCNKPP